MSDFAIVSPRSRRAVQTGSRGYGVHHDRHPALVAGACSGLGCVEDIPEPAGPFCARDSNQPIETGGSVDLMEYQAKELFAKHGVTTTLGTVVETAEDARKAAEEIGGVTVIKAQVKAGGRGKAGGVKRAKTADEAFEHATNILNLTIKDLPVNRVLVTPATPPQEEYYFSFLLDRSNRQYLCIASVEGGVEIEEVAKTNPDAVKKIAIDPGK